MRLASQKTFLISFVFYLLIVIVANSTLPNPLWNKLFIALVAIWIFIFSYLLTFFIRGPRLSIILAQVKGIEPEKELDLFLHVSSLRLTTVFVFSFIVIGLITIALAFIKILLVEYLLGFLTFGVGVYYFLIKKVIYDFFKNTIIRIRAFADGDFDLNKDNKVTAPFKPNVGRFNVKGGLAFLLILIFILLFFWLGSKL